MTSILDPNDGDHLLAWPKLVLAAELARRIRIAATTAGRQRGWRWSAGVGRLLRSAFQGPSLAEEFDALGAGVGYSDNISPDQVAWLTQLNAELDAARGGPAPRPYWSQRRGVQGETLGLALVAERFVTLVRRVDDNDGLWGESFGVGCPDGVGDPIDEPTLQINDRLGRQLPDLMWPLAGPTAKSWSRDDLFDLIEVLHDLASWPGTWDSHNFGGCIGHPGDFSPACGRALYRHEVNTLLSRSDLGVRLADAGEDQGRIVIHDGAALAEAVDEALESAPRGHQPDVAHAVALFRQRGRDVASMRSAVVALAGVVEAHRSLLKRELLSKDEGALFDIANSFDLRHRRADQRTDYDPAFLEWLFHWYLATVSLIAKFSDETQAGSRYGRTNPGS